MGSAGSVFLRASLATPWILGRWQMTAQYGRGGVVVGVRNTFTLSIGDLALLTAAGYSSLSFIRSLIE